jgi:hypothetical protein
MGSSKRMRVTRDLVSLQRGGCDGHPYSRALDVARADLGTESYYRVRTIASDCALEAET